MADIDKLFEKMSRECANSMTGTHPPKHKAVKKKTTTKKKVSKKTKK